MSIDSVVLSKHLILCCSLLLSPSIFPSIRIFSSESDLPVRWPEYWSFSFSISPSNECSRLVSFRTDWFDLHAVQGTLKSLLQYQLLQYQQCKSINSLELSLLYGPSLWKDYSFDYTDLCQQSDASAF